MTWRQSSCVTPTITMKLSTEPARRAALSSSGPLLRYVHCRCTHICLPEFFFFCCVCVCVGGGGGCTTCIVVLLYTVYTDIQLYSSNLFLICTYWMHHLGQAKQDLARVEVRGNGY